MVARHHVGRVTVEAEARSGVSFGDVPNLDFYALPSDLPMVLEAVFGAAPASILLELASRPDLPIRRFASAEEAAAEIDLDDDHANLGIYDPSLGGPVRERSVVFTPGAVPGATGRTIVEAWGLIQLYLPMTEAGVLHPWHTNHSSERRARARLGEDSDEFHAWDWAGIARLSSRVNRRIRALAVGREGSRPILPGAAVMVREGWRLAAL
jgi:hypothetical protein